jgi:hypothetical protein
MTYPVVRKASAHDYCNSLPKNPVFLALSRQRTASPSLHPIAEQPQSLGVHGNPVVSVIPRGPRGGILLQTKVVLLQSVRVVNRVQENREPRLPILRCCLTHSRERLLHAGPTLSSAHAALMRVPFERSPSLYPFGTQRSGLVRWGSRYSGAVRLLLSAHHRHVFLDFPMLPIASSGTGGQWISSFPLRCLRASSKPLTARGLRTSRDIDAPDMAFRISCLRRPPEVIFRGSMARLYIPLPRFPHALTGCRGMNRAEGSCGSLNHQCMKFSFTTTCRLDRLFQEGIRHAS